MNLCSNTDFSKYKHFISLGGNCYVAEDLSHMGLRDCSYPFDWLFSDDFSGIVLAIEDRFKDLTTEHLLFQHKNNRSRYYNQKYKFSFFMILVNICLYQNNWPKLKQSMSEGQNVF